MVANKRTAYCEFVGATSRRDRVVYMARTVHLLLRPATSTSM
jgi:hypothetical protein